MYYELVSDADLQPDQRLGAGALAGLKQLQRDD